MREPEEAGVAPLLKVQGLGVRYGRRTVFAGIELSLERGTCLVVAGRNGAGKSTLLRVLAGLVRPTHGSVTLSPAPGASIEYGRAAGASEDLLHYVGMSSPDLELYSEMTAAENLLFFAGVRGLSLARDDINRSLAQVGLADRGDERLDIFSSGMRQRMRLLFAVQHCPMLLLLDEPGSNLDEHGQELVAGIVREQLDRGIVILATNDRAEMRLGQQVLRLDEREPSRG